MNESEFEPVEEKIYVIPLTKARLGKGYDRTKRAIRVLREFVEKHMKSDNIKITTELNELIWARGIRNPPRRVRVKALRNEEDEVRVYPA